MFSSAELLLLASVIGVGVLHTMVPDHWAPIALLARQRGWTRGETARAALMAGIGHVGTTLAFGVAVWLLGVAFAQRYGYLVNVGASVALIGFGAWIAIGAWREVRGDHDAHHHGHEHAGHDHGHDHNHQGWEHDPLYAASRSEFVAERHVHLHRHDRGPAHSHWHDHSAGTAHAVTADALLGPPVHVHRHATTGRTALLLVLGSSPMVEGIPAFFAASRYGIGLMLPMSVLFAASTIATYVVLSVYSASGLQKLNLGSVERYGEVISGGFIALVGLVFGLMSI